MSRLARKHSRWLLPVLFWCILSSRSLADDTAEPDFVISHPPIEAPAGESFWLPIAITELNAPIGTLVLELHLDPAQAILLELETAPELAAMGKQHHYQIQQGTQLRFICTWGDAIQEPMTLFRLRIAAQINAGDVMHWLDQYRLSAACPSALAMSGVFHATPLPVLPGEQIFHSADIDRNHRIDLRELLRGIQFYQAGAYHCDPMTEDGYAPGAAPSEDCGPHDSDFQAPAWRIDLPELLHLAQLYNAPGYVLVPELTERFRPRLH